MLIKAIYELFFAQIISHSYGIWFNLLKRFGIFCARGPFEVSKLKDTCSKIVTTWPAKMWPLLGSYPYSLDWSLHTLQRRHNQRDDVSDPQRLDCLLNRLLQIKENINVPRHWPLWGEFTGDRWIPLIKGQWRGKCFHLLTSSYSTRNLKQTLNVESRDPYMLSLSYLRQSRKLRNGREMTGYMGLS